MTEREFRRKFKELEESAKSEQERPVLLHLRFKDGEVKGQIRSMKKILFHYPASFNPRLQLSEKIVMTRKEAKRHFAKHTGYGAAFIPDNFEGSEYGYIV